MMMTQIGVNGLLVLDKPPGITSRTAVDQAQLWFPKDTRMGHTGTLDPLATGVLVLCLGLVTRFTQYVQRMSKVYRATLLLGARSDTDDAGGTVVPAPDARQPDSAAVKVVLAGFVGETEQVPPDYSAAWVDGKRAYALARKGRDVELQPRLVTIHRIDVIRYAWPLLDLEVHCGKGTYIRSLARDLGDQLGCGALVHTLRRTRVGPFTTDAAVTLDTPAEEVRARLRPALEALSELPRIVLQPEEAVRVSHGQSVPLSHLENPLTAGNGEVAIVDIGGRLVGVGHWLPSRRLLKPDKVWRG
jgi:tRNA pseudouridine55 synthase